MGIDANQSKIEQQRQLVFGKQPVLELMHPCKLDHGIITFPLSVQEKLVGDFDQHTGKITFFIPASGSGSRMFQFLHEFIENKTGEESGQVERFFNHIEDFAFYQKIPDEITDLSLFEDSNLDKFIHFILDEEGLGFSNSPKGLIPFHKHGPFILNAFQEQVLQANKIGDKRVQIHFTINSKFEQEIKKSIRNVEELTGKRFDVSFSIQDPLTDAITFDEDQQAVKLENGNLLTRPAGHGALLQNLNAIEADLIFIKNIDNIQNSDHSKSAENTLKYLGGIAFWFQEEIRKLRNQPSLESLRELNEQFQFLSESHLEKLKTEDLTDLFKRPIRVCGMVRNEGQPGGGPFWVEDQGKVSKQIIEKAQISNRPDQFKLMVQSTHFNPVMIAAITKDLDGNKVDLNRFTDNSSHFIVEKNHKGKNISYSELPGLWNGSMAYWNTIFVEIPSETFTPVKTVLDLLDSAHLEEE